ncbi:hypothetical protein ABID12_002649 [Martelella mangrovi]|uniref:Uncharacterized protein n=1 Tax=Martelella mangrovi TaxID=1397477 RepID=A0ABV2ICR2_9HYPH
MADQISPSSRYGELDTAPFWTLSRQPITTSSSATILP